LLRFEVPRLIPRSFFVRPEFELSIGDPGRIRTCDLQLRRLLLYPLSYGATRCCLGWVGPGYKFPRGVAMMKAQGLQRPLRRVGRGGRRLGPCFRGATRGRLRGWPCRACGPMTMRDALCRRTGKIARCSTNHDRRPGQSFLPRRAAVTTAHGSCGIMVCWPAVDSMREGFVSWMRLSHCSQPSETWLQAG
jgi:hypothetical protein